MEASRGRKLSSFGIASVNESFRLRGVVGGEVGPIRSAEGERLALAGL